VISVLSKLAILAATNRLFNFDEIVAGRKILPKTRAGKIQHNMN
jgi:hypothetical protein